MIGKLKPASLKIRGRKNDNIKPAASITHPTNRYIYPKTDIISLIFSLFCSNRGRYRTYPIAAPIPISARLRKPNKFCNVPVKPTKSAPKESRKIFLEKNCYKIKMYYKI